MTDTTPRSVKVLHECAELQLKKSQDYQSAASSVTQADYYPSGIKTIYEIMLAKMLRMKSLIEKGEANARIREQQTSGTNFESLEDSARDLINYASFFVSYMEREIPGQNQWNDMFNRPFEFVPMLDVLDGEAEKQAEHARKKCEEWIKAQEMREALKREVDNG